MTAPVRTRRARTLRGLVVSFLAVASTVFVDPVDAQVLDLDSGGRMPAIEGGVLAELAERSLERIEPERDAPESVRATNQLRRIVAELAVRGLEGGPTSAIEGLAALRLGDAVGGIARRLASIEDAGAFIGSPPRRLTDDERDRALGRLATFSRIGLDELRRRASDSPEAFEETLALVLAPIRDALEIVESSPLRSHWPSAAAVQAGGGVSVRSIPDPLPDRPGLVEADRALGSLPPHIARPRRATLRTIASRIASLEDGGDSVLHRRLEETLDQAVRIVSERPASEQAVEALQSLDEASALAASIQVLGRSEKRRDVDPEILADLAAETLLLEDRRSRRLLIARQRLVTDLLLAAGTLDSTSVDRRLRTAARRIEARRRKVIRTAVADLQRFATDPDAVSDPAAIGGLKSLESTVADMSRLAGSGVLVDRLTSIRPGANPQLDQWIGSWVRDLGDENRRAEAASRLDRVAEDLDRFQVLPGERRLRLPDPTLEALTAGRVADLRSLVEETRRLWVDEISNGESDGPARDSMALLHRLLRAMSDLDAITTDRDEVAFGIETCNRWGAWYVPREAIAWSARTLEPQVRLAVASAVRGDEDRLVRDLDRLERRTPPARLVSVLASRLRGPLASSRGGSVGALASLAIPPDTDAWGLDLRRRLASVCRAFAEQAAARLRGDAETARSLADWLVDACDDLVDRIDSPWSASTTDSTRSEDSR
ncbi:MAG: hypothetical protein VX012_07340 [Planctomycetota bacterium]|nr:hypothetical protein [Planctomycetota bacterium]